MTAADSCLHLTFHGIGVPRRELAGGERDVWISAKRFEAILDRVDGRADVRLSFDDGNVSDVEIALEQLCTRRLQARFFVVADRLGKPGFLTADQLSELDRAGMWIGCHGMRHRPWRKLGERDLRDELVVARARLEDAVGQRIDEAACPFGSYDRRVLGWLRRLGYRHAFTSDGGGARDGLWLQARNTVSESDDGGLSAGAPSVRSAAVRAAKLAVKRWR